MIKVQGGNIVLAWAFVVERVTRIELALSAWEAERLRLLGALTWQSCCSRVTVVDPSSPWLTGPLMARRPHAELRRVRWRSGLLCLPYSCPSFS